jgi:hypothetical protein
MYRKNKNQFRIEARTEEHLAEITEADLPRSSPKGQKLVAFGGRSTNVNGDLRATFALRPLESWKGRAETTGPHGSPKQFNSKMFCSPQVMGAHWTRRRWTGPRRRVHYEGR